MSTLKSLLNKPGDMLPGQRYNLTPPSIYGKGPTGDGGRPFSLFLSYDTRSIQPVSASSRLPVIPLYSMASKLQLPDGYVRTETAKIWQRDLRHRLNAGPPKGPILANVLARYYLAISRFFSSLMLLFFLKLVAYTFIYNLYFMKNWEQFQISNLGMHF